MSATLLNEYGMVRYSLKINSLLFDARVISKSETYVVIKDRQPGTRLPGAPVAPATPIGPGAPVQPGLPALPVSPGGPGRPGAPKPAGPVAPVMPGRPGNPGQPIDPTKPGTPAHNDEKFLKHRACDGG